ncbi:hypothetical protein ACRRTK_000933 [Alexandromys fortis]
MVPVNLPMGILFFSQTAVGILGNWSILLPYAVSEFTGKSLMPKDQILRHLTLANSLVIISRVIPHIMVQLGLQFLLDDLLCKLTLYSNRVSRGISLHCTCLLSCFQAITISPSNSRWMKLKHSVSKYMVQSCSLSWLVHLLLNSKTAVDVIGSGTNKNFTKKIKLGYCSAFVSGNTVSVLEAVILSVSDIMCLVLMAWASGSMVLVLHKHKHRVQHIHSYSLSQRPSHEDRATRTILILVTMFLSFYSLASILSFCITQTVNPSPWLLNTSVLLSLSFPTLSPLVFSFSNICVPHFCCVFWIKKNSPTVVSDV